MPYGVPLASAVAKRSVASLLALILAVGGLLSLAITKVVVAFYSVNDDSVVLVLGSLGLATIVPIVIVVVVGHLALGVTTKKGLRGRATAGVALGIGYSLLLFWIVRLINSATVVLSGDYGSDALVTLVRNIFYWA